MPTKVAFKPLSQPGEATDRINRILGGNKDPILINQEVYGLQQKIETIKKAKNGLEGMLNMFGRGTSNGAPIENQIRDCDQELATINSLLEKLRQVSETPTLGQKKANVLYDFTAADETQLTITMGETITLLEGGDNNWTYAESLLNGRRGYVPKQYVQVQETVQNTIPRIQEHSYIQPTVQSSLITPIQPVGNTNIKPSNPSQSSISPRSQPSKNTYQDIVPAPPPPPLVRNEDNERGSLLNSITGFTKNKLKKSVTNDRSAPIVSSEKSSASATIGKSSGNNMMADILNKKSQMGPKKSVEPAVPFKKNPSPVPPRNNSHLQILKEGTSSIPIPTKPTKVASPVPSPIGNTVKVKQSPPSNSSDHESVASLREEIKQMKEEFYREINFLKSEIDYLKQQLGQ